MDQETTTEEARIDLHQSELNGFALWLEFLDHAKVGISLNKITIRHMTRISCGYNLRGLAW
jgi:hypothetical protein